VQLFSEGHLSSEALEAQVFGPVEAVIADRVAASRGQQHRSDEDVQVRARRVW
jgi:hypothetical protein